MVHQLVDIVSKNGNLLLNIGPRSDGTIPDEVQAVLRDIGSWLKINGEAIYGTRPWRIYGEGPTQVAAGGFHDTDTASYTPRDFRFTSKGPTLYALELGWPENGEALIHSLARDVAGDKKSSPLPCSAATQSLTFSSDRMVCISCYRSRRHANMRTHFGLHSRVQHPS